MAITKKYLKSKPVCKVTFELAGIKASEIVVVGDFNKWDNQAAPLKKFKNGKFKTTVNLAANKSYEFRYIADGVYMNDNQADSYKLNEFDSENGVLSL
ncbi:MAG: isoamylase early set domain-containing protein [Flavobacteriaceae bacterium]|nr:isoamylase early set domain-containing protein [Flavobacteriaceae bacterium]